jgi:hypothetical protein
VFSPYVPRIGCLSFPAQRAHNVITHWKIMARRTSRFAQRKLTKNQKVTTNQKPPQQRRQSLVHFLTLLFAY